MSARIIALLAQNPEVTTQEIMQMETFRHFTEEQAIELLRTIDTFCEIAYSIWSKEEKRKATEPQIIPLTPQLKKQAA